MGKPPKRKTSVIGTPESGKSSKQEKGKDKAVEEGNAAAAGDGEEYAPEGEDRAEYEEEELEEKRPPDGPKLDDGYYEIEDVRMKRTRKGQVQYLIKWRGWPEAANTWEPIENLHDCRDILEAYEESIRSSGSRQKRRRKTNYLSKKRRSVPSESQSRPSLSEAENDEEWIEGDDAESVTEANNPLALSADIVAGLVGDSEVREEEALSDVMAKGEESKVPVSVPRRIITADTDSANDFHGYDTDGGGVKLAEEKPGVGGEQVALGGTKNYKEEGSAGGISIHFQDIASPSSLSLFNQNDGFSDGPNSQVGTDNRFTGAKRRKSGNVKRFNSKQDSSSAEQKESNSSHGAEPCIDGDGVQPPNTMDDEGINNVKGRDHSCLVTQIIKAVNYTTFTTNTSQQVAISFRALRSDGNEVVVDNEFLKVHNPLLLINFYEQHLRYCPV